MIKEILLPIRRAPLAEKQLDLALRFQLAKRRRFGAILSQVVLSRDERREYLGISSLGTPPCALYYSLTQAEKEETDTGSQFGFDTGHVLEAYILDLLEISPHCRQRELVWPYPKAPGGMIVGHPDGILERMLPGGSCVIECKATGGYSFDKKREEGPDMGHLEQVFCYASKLMAPLFAVIYANREAKKSTPFYQVFAYRIIDPQRAALAVQALFDVRFGQVLDCLQTKRPAQPLSPKVEFGARGWRCRPDTSYFAHGKAQKQVGYCSYRSVCPEAQEYSAAVRRKEEEKQAA